MIEPQTLTELDLARLSPAGFAVFASRLCNQDPWDFHQYLKPLNDMSLDIAAGTVKRAIWTLPRRWGKSEFMVYLVGWYLGICPRGKVIVASAESELAVRWCRRIRDIFARAGPEAFGFGVDPTSYRQDSWATTRGGTCYGVGAGGGITGRGATLLVIDDALKNDEEARSEGQRANLLEWFYSVAMGTLEPNGGVLVIGTRWHPFDLIGELLASNEKAGALQWEHVLLPALDERGESTSPRISTEEVLARKAQMPDYWFECQYQGAPYLRDAGFFSRRNFPIVRRDSLHPLSSYLNLRAWDRAGSESQSADWTATIRLSKDKDAKVYITDAYRFRATPGKRDAKIQDIVGRDEPGTLQLFPVDPGSAGLSEMHETKRLLSGFRVAFCRMTGSKATRANAVAAFSENSSQLFLVEGPQIEDFLRELESFPGGRHDDFVDCLSLGFSGGPDAEQPGADNFVRGIGGRTYLPNFYNTLTDEEERMEALKLMDPSAFIDPARDDAPDFSDGLGLRPAGPGTTDPHSAAGLDRIIRLWRGGLRTRP